MKKVNHSCAHLFLISFQQKAERFVIELGPMLCLMKAGTLHERNLQTATEMNLKMEERISQFYLIGTKPRKRRINKGKN